MIPSIASFEILGLSSSCAEAIVHIEPIFASSGVIASYPYKSLNRVKPVDLDTKVLWPFTL
jgi:hypothetical protein